MGPELCIWSDYWHKAKSFKRLQDWPSVEVLKGIDSKEHRNFLAY
jgi:hypothetical protein